MEVMVEFNQTEIGNYPKSWNLIELSKISAFITKGSTPTTYGFKWKSFGILFLRSECVSEDGLDLTQSKYISLKAHQALKRSEIKKGDILVTITGNVGRAVVYELNEEANINQHIARVRVNSEFINRNYVYHFLSQKNCITRFNSITTGQAYPQLSLKQVRDNLIALPEDINEQIVIAEALNDSDSLIRSLEKLIEKKRQIKQGAMQELLTGKKRLPGSSNEWQEKEIWEVVQTPVTDGPHLTPNFVAEGVPFLSVNNIVNNKIDDTDLRFISKMDDEVFSRKCKPRKGDLLLGKAASVGKVALVENDWDFNIWSPIALIRVNSKNSSKFVYYQLQSESVIKQITLLTNSSSQGNIGMGDIEKIKLNLPMLDEQLEIAKFFSDMDSELFELEGKLTKARQIKQGMMQELLTGRIRLV